MKRLCFVLLGAMLHLLVEPLDAQSATSAVEDLSSTFAETLGEMWEAPITVAVVGFAAENPQSAELLVDLLSETLRRHGRFAGYQVVDAEPLDVSWLESHALNDPPPTQGEPLGGARFVIFGRRLADEADGRWVLRAWLFDNQTAQVVGREAIHYEPRDVCPSATDVDGYERALRKRDADALRRVVSSTDRTFDEQWSKRSVHWAYRSSIDRQVEVEIGRTGWWERLTVGLSAEKSARIATRIFEHTIESQPMQTAFLEVGGAVAQQVTPAAADLLAQIYEAKLACTYAFTARRQGINVSDAFLLQLADPTSSGGSVELSAAGFDGDGTRPRVDVDIGGRLGRIIAEEIATYIAEARWVCRKVSGAPAPKASTHGTEASVASRREPMARRHRSAASPDSADLRAAL